MRIIAATKTIAAIPERCTALRTVGGLLKRSMRAWRALVLRSAGPGLRPVRPRVSPIPAALARRLGRRVRLVEDTRGAVGGAASGGEHQRLRRLFAFGPPRELSRSSMLARLRIG